MRFDLSNTGEWDWLSALQIALHFGVFSAISLAEMASEIQQNGPQNAFMPVLH